MKYLFLPIHFVVGGLIRLVDYATTPTPIKRTDSEQQSVEEKCKNLTLYQYPSCPFCIRVKRNMKKLNLPVRLVDPRKDPQWRKALEEEGGKVQVPCLQIVDGNGSSTWMYESADINQYLIQQFSE